MNRLPMYTSGTYCVWCNICVTTIPEIHGESRGLSLLVVPYLPNLGQLAGAWQQTGKLPPRYADIDRLRITGTGLILSQSALFQFAA